MTEPQPDPADARGVGIASREVQRKQRTSDNVFTENGEPRVEVGREEVAQGRKEPQGSSQCAAIRKVRVLQAKVALKVRDEPVGHEGLRGRTDVSAGFEEEMWAGGVRSLLRRG